MVMPQALYAVTAAGVFDRVPLRLREAASAEQGRPGVDVLQ